MKIAITIGIVASLSLIALGCSSPKGGGVAANESMDRGGGISGEEWFTLSTPLFNPTVRQGETQSVTITVHRGEYFKRDVRLNISASSGLIVEPSQALVKASDIPEVHLRITAARDAALGKYVIYLKGTPETGEATSTDFTVKVVSP